MTDISQKSISRRIIRVFQDYPKGISVTQLRQELRLGPTEQQHLDRRIRELDEAYVIDRKRRGNQTLYVLKGERDVPLAPAAVDKTTRARIIHLSGRKCEMCGRTVAEDSIKLQVDHKVPREWGAPTEDDNLWALCSECNQGKRNFFSSITDHRIQQAMLHDSVHIRLGELLKAFAGTPVPKAYLNIVAYTHDDYEKRLRELRELGWRYHVQKRKEGPRFRTYFILDEWKPWPADPAKAIREAEAAKGKKRGR